MNDENPWIAAALAKQRHQIVREAHAAGLTVAQISEKTGVPRRTVRDILDRPDDWEPKATQRQKILALCKMGLHAQEIAKSLGLKQGSVQKAITEMRRNGQLPPLACNEAKQQIEPIQIRDGTMRAARVPYTERLPDDPALAASLERLRLSPGILPKPNEQCDTGWVAAARKRAA
jgi:predicted transcriptional regulator